MATQHAEPIDLKPQATVAATSGPKVAYVMSRFPKITETFILYEILEVERLGVHVDIYPLMREREPVMHVDAEALVARANYAPLISWSILAAQLHFLMKKPGVYLRTLWRLLRGTWGARRFFAGAIVFFPKAVYFAKKMADERIDHLHAHFANHPAAVAFVVHRLTGIPYSFVAHGSEVYRSRKMLSEKVADAEFVVPISDYIRRIILDECGESFRDKVTVIHCGIDCHFFETRRETAHRETTSGPFRILCVGSLHEGKGQKYLVEACRLLRERGVDVVCDLLGGGPEMESLIKQVADASLEGFVRLHGPQPRSEVRLSLQRTDLFVSCSVPTADLWQEGIPVVLMEAMGSGLPVIATRMSGVPELVEDGVTGMLLPPRDSDALADAIERLHADEPLRLQLSKAAREKVEREFNLHVSAAELVRRFAASSSGISKR